MTDQENSERQDAKVKKPGELLVGKVLFERFEVLEVLGESAMALVLKAREVQTDRLVAIKTVTPHDPETVRRFAQELQLHGSLKHKNIVEAIDSLEAAGGRTFFIMEFLSGASLHRVLQTQTRLENEDELASILLQVCDALAFAHQFGVLHRDLKPGNIFLLERDNKLNVKVLDFGIAKPLGQQTGLTQAGYAVGSPLYMSPEQCRGHAVDFRSDVYSLGILAYEMATGQLPYAGHNIMTVMAAHCDPDRKPQHLNTHVPELRRVDDLNATIQTAMETDPAKRFQTINEFKNSVQKWHDAVKKEFLSTLVPGQPRNTHPDTKTAVAEQVSRSATGTTDSAPKVPESETLNPKRGNGAPEQSSLSNQQQDPQLQERQKQQQLEQQQVEQQQVQRAQHQQMMEQQQVQPQQQHQQMQRQQMKPLPPPQQTQEEIQQQDLQSQQQEQLKLRELQQEQQLQQLQQQQFQQQQAEQQAAEQQLRESQFREQQAQAEQMHAEQMRVEQEKASQAQAEKVLAEQAQAQQLAQQQEQQQQQLEHDQEQQQLQDWRDQQLKNQAQQKQDEIQQKAQQAEAPTAVPRSRLGATQDRDSQSESNSLSTDELAPTEPKNRLRSRLSIGDADSPPPKKNTKVLIIIVAVVMVLLMIALLVLGKLLLQ
ncbi:MAG: serine/threonine-protein kinase [Candidatus Melainabacteria bacterium]|nr:serine/threonine-protein kinase [Candidatus Melainabacteria bacterium]